MNQSEREATRRLIDATVRNLDWSAIDDARRALEELAERVEPEVPPDRMTDERLAEIEGASRLWSATARACIDELLVEVRRLREDLKGPFSYALVRLLMARGVNVEDELRALELEKRP